MQKLMEPLCCYGMVKDWRGPSDEAMYLFCSEVRPSPPGEGLPFKSSFFLSVRFAWRKT